MHTFSLKFVVFFAALHFLQSCEGKFVGMSGSNGIFKSEPEPNPTGSPIPTIDTLNSIHKTQVNPGPLTDDGSLDTRHYKPAIVKTLRRDKGAGNSQNDGDGSIYDQSRISLNYKVIGARKAQTGVIPGEAKEFEIKEACPDQGTVKVELSFATPEGEIKPNKNTSIGGPIGFRRADNIIWIAMERQSVGKAEEAAYHNNDDLVLEIACPNAKRIEVSELCFDQRIPAAPGTRGGKSYSGLGSDLVTDEETHSGDGMGRQCTGI